MLVSLLADKADSINMIQLGLCTVTSFALGIMVALVCMHRNIYRKNFIVALLVLPSLIQFMMMLIQDDVARAIILLGVFGIMRVSVETGESRETMSLLWAIGIGIATGFGYIIYVITFSLVLSILLLLMQSISFGGSGRTAKRVIKIMIPETLDYPNLFDDLFKKYLQEFTMESVKTTNMGSLYELAYVVKFKDIENEKNLIDEIRIRNGNLTVISAKVDTN
ncbi:DUF4956 domain-containing protein [uncultured Vagococcus sp.]|uniref:DUF4956 domain-containing protein n=1 Tax=uncultured Vagococcus sp. TaxID=189676 RepID=UPI0028D6806F|nr:DUF4956 domain-containing protein [uncultured Vagococcus sp.]